MAIGGQSVFEIRNEEASQDIKSKLVIFPSHYFNPEHKETGTYQGESPVFCNQLWDTTLKRYKQDPTVNLEELHDAHMRRLNERLG